MGGKVIRVSFGLLCFGAHGLGSVLGRSYRSASCGVHDLKGQGFECVASHERRMTDRDGAEHQSKSLCYAGLDGRLTLVRCRKFSGIPGMTTGSTARPCFLSTSPTQMPPTSNCPASVWSARHRSHQGAQHASTAQHERVAMALIYTDVHDMSEMGAKLAPTLKHTKSHSPNSTRN